MSPEAPLYNGPTEFRSSFPPDDNLGAPSLGAHDQLSGEAKLTSDENVAFESLADLFSEDSLSEIQKAELISRDASDIAAGRVIRDKGVVIEDDLGRKVIDTDTTQAAKRERVAVFETAMAAAWTAERERLNRQLKTDDDDDDELTKARKRRGTRAKSSQEDAKQQATQEDIEKPAA